MNVKKPLKTGCPVSGDMTINQPGKMPEKDQASFSLSNYNNETKRCKTGFNGHSSAGCDKCRYYDIMESPDAGYFRTDGHYLLAGSRAACSMPHSFRAFRMERNDDARKRKSHPRKMDENDS